MDGYSENQARSNDSGQADRHGQFLRLYAKHQHQIASYIYTLLGNRADAEDLLQDTTVLLWEKFDEFELGTHFVAWACRVAFLKVLNHRRRFDQSNLLFNDELLATVAGRTVELTPHLDDRREALRECLKRLEDRDRRMVLARYEPGGGVEQAAGASGRSLQATYKALYRIRRALFDCVTLRIGGNAAS